MTFTGRGRGKACNSCSIRGILVHLTMTNNLGMSSGRRKGSHVTILASGVRLALNIASYYNLPQKALSTS